MNDYQRLAEELNARYGNGQGIFHTSEKAGSYTDDFLGIVESITFDPQMNRINIKLQSHWMKDRLASTGWMPLQKTMTYTFMPEKGSALPKTETGFKVNRINATTYLYHSVQSLQFHVKDKLPEEVIGMKKKEEDTMVA